MDVVVIANVVPSIEKILTAREEKTQIENPQVGFQPVDRAQDDPPQIRTTEPTRLPTEIPVVQRKAGGIDSEVVEARIFELVNERREALHLHPLLRWQPIDALARDHSRDMAERNYFDHYNPEGADPSGRASLADVSCLGIGSNYYGLGENIHKWENFRGTDTQLAEAMMDSWMDSYGHRQNILNVKYDRIGVGVHELSGVVYATQTFCLAPGWESVN